MNLKVVGQNVILLDGESKLTKRIIEKDERVSFIELSKKKLDLLNSKISNSKKEAVKQELNAMFTVNSEINKQKAKTDKKKEKNKEIAIVKEVSNLKSTNKKKKEKIEKSLSNSEVNEKLKAENDSLIPELKAINEKKNETETLNRFGEGGRRYGSISETISVNSYNTSESDEEYDEDED